MKKIIIMLFILLLSGTITFAGDRKGYTLDGRMSMMMPDLCECFMVNRDSCVIEEIETHNILVQLFDNNDDGKADFSEIFQKVEIEGEIVYYYLGQTIKTNSKELKKILEKKSGEIERHEKCK